MTLAQEEARVEAHSAALRKELGVRDLALGAGLLWAQSRDEPVHPWLVGAAVADTVDAAADIRLGRLCARGARLRAGDVVRLRLTRVDDLAAHRVHGDREQPWRVRQPRDRPLDGAGGTALLPPDRRERILAHNRLQRRTTTSRRT